MASSEIDVPSSSHNTQSTLEQFCTMIETQFSKKIKTIRTDNGTEFIMSDFFAKKAYYINLVVFKPLNKYNNQVISQVVVAIDLYSASAKDLETTSGEVVTLFLVHN